MQYPKFWIEASSKRKRIYLFLVVFAGIFLLTVIGSLIPMDRQTADLLVNELKKQVSDNQANNSLIPFIFLNNFRSCLLFFIPIGGVAFGGFVFFSTGFVIGAEAIYFGFPPLLLSLGEVVNPIFYIEFTAYAIAITESIWLTRRLLQHRYGELKNTAILIGICAMILLLGAVIESMLPLI
jgi:hypothetical protein